LSSVAELQLFFTVPVLVPTFTVMDPVLGLTPYLDHSKSFLYEEKIESFHQIYCKM
jgi:hypothetical protein